jgi:hypothetical protein
MGECAEGKGLGGGSGKVWVRIGGLGTLGFFGDFGDFGRQIRLGDRLIQGLSFKPWISPS